MKFKWVDSIMWNRQVGGHIYKNQPINEAIY